MNQRRSAFAAALALTALLTACGNRQQPSEESQNGTATKPDSSVSDTIRDPEQDVTEQDPMTDTPETTPTLPEEDAGESGVSIEQLLKNARMHDRDGRLLNGEHAASTR